MEEPETPDVVDGKVKRKGERTRQSVSCAECRRLKLKCSREWPCTSCQKRGCAQICPDGEMRTVRGRRLVVGETEDLHQRILNLENALAESHAHQSSDPHPLLTKTYHQTRPRRLVSWLDPDESEQVVEQAFGTLTVGLGGEARFVGSLAGSEYLHDEDEPPTGDGVFSPRRDGDMSGLATPPPIAGFPLIAPGHQLELLGLEHTTGDIGQLRGLLPDWEDEGKGLIEAYWENVNWMHQIIPRPMFDIDHLANAYDTTAAPHAQKLACAFLVMALGVLFDLNRTAYDPRSKELFKLGVKCIQAGGLQRPSPALVQALHLCGTFLLNDNDSSGAETFWPILGTAVKVAQRLGLHRDGETFGLSPYEVKERRQVWWELITHDRLQSLCFGHVLPATSLPIHYIPRQTTSSPIGIIYALVQLMEQAIDLQTQPAPVPIQQVLTIDQQFQNFIAGLPDELLPNATIESIPLDNTIHPHLILHQLGIRLLMAQTRLLLNRPAFARALRDRPGDPAVGSMGQSFVALYESALEIVQLVKALVVYHPSLIARWGFYWHHAASSCACLSAITIQAPNCAFASPAFHAMTSIVDICKASKEGSRAKRMLPTFLRLQARASEALRTAVKSGRQSQGEDVTVPEDDLYHMRNSVKLRRINPARRSTDAEFNQPLNSATPTPRPSTAEAIPTALDHSPVDASPVSLGSIATSDTMVEVIVNDFGGQLWSMPLRGAVPPPPPDGSTSSPVVPIPAQAPTLRLRPRQSSKRPRRSMMQETHTETGQLASNIVAHSVGDIDQGAVWQPLLSRPVPAFRPPTWDTNSASPALPVVHNRTHSYPPMPYNLPPVEETDELMAGPSTAQDLPGDAHAAYQYILSRAGQATNYVMPSPATSGTIVPSPAEMAAQNVPAISESSQLVDMTTDPFDTLYSPDLPEEDYDFDMFVHHMPDGYTVMNE